MSLSEALQTTGMTLCRSLHAEELQATVNEGLGQGPYTWRLERDPNARPSGRKASTLPMRHHAPHQLPTSRPPSAHAKQ